MSSCINDTQLALEGGQPSVTTRFPSWPFYAEDEVEAVQKVLRSGRVNYWTGDLGQNFEKNFADYFGVKYAVALANGSVALELALDALGIGAGDEVIVTSRTFIASVSSICLKGATPVFADVDEDSQNITAQSIDACITSKTRAIILVHLAGWPCDMLSILELVKNNNLKLIEDCAQAHGAKYDNKYVGSFGDVATFSFCQDKIMTTGGEGGMLITNDEVVWRKAWMYKDHGKHFESMRHDTASDKSKFQWVHNSFGTNLRMTEMQAAIGIKQLGKLSAWINKRQTYANKLNECFSKIDALRVTLPDDNITHAFYKYYVFLRPELLKSGWNRDKVIQAITAEGVPCFAGSCSEVYKEKAFIDAGLSPKTELKTAKKLGETSLMFNVHPTLAVKDIEIMCNAAEKVLSHVSK